MKNRMMVLCFAVFSSTGWCGARDVLQDKLTAMTTLSASFSQTVKAKQKVVGRSSGTMALSKPGRFRWETKKPMPQLIVADGKKIWVYDIELEQVTVKPQTREVGGAAALFLGGIHEQLLQDFNVLQQQSGAQDIFDLKSKSDSANFQRIKLTFSGQTLRKIELIDTLGQDTEITLNQVKNNIKLNTSLFQFKPPKGVDVVVQQ